MALQEMKKMKQGMSYSRKEKTIILNVLKYFVAEYPDKNITTLIRRTSKATGCSEKSIFQFRKEEGSAEGLKQPSRTKTRSNININSRYIKYDQSVREAIRNIIYDLKSKTVTPSLGTILGQIHLDAGLPKFSLMTLRRLLYDMGFYYEKIGSKFELLERDSNETDENKFKENSNTSTGTSTSTGTGIDSPSSSCDVMKFNRMHQEEKEREILGNSYEEIITVSNNTLVTENTPPLPPINIASNTSTNIMGHPLGQQGLRSETMQFNQPDPAYMYNHQNNIHNMMGGIGAMPMPPPHHQHQHHRNQMPNMHIMHAKPPHVPHWAQHSASHPAPFDQIPKQN